MNPMTLFAIVCSIAALPLLPIATSDQDPAPASTSKANRYIGATLCKNCHTGAEKGDQFEHWAKSPHAKAWETLGTPKAKELGAKVKIDDPQKSEQCLKCHVTAYGVDEKEIKKGFKIENGVQCETCHGPGENHFKLRFAESQKGGAAAPVTEGEILIKRDAATCQKCHNDKSPSYQPFCLKERMEKIEHLDPRKKRSDDDLKKLRAVCFPECTKCATPGGAKKDAGK